MDRVKDLIFYLSQKVGRLNCYTLLKFSIILGTALIVLAINFAFPIYWKVAAADTVVKDEYSDNVLYTALRDMVFPEYRENIGKPVAERFILLTPGKILNYYDYCPYDKLEAHQRENSPLPRLPPDENTFNLVDTLPTPNPVGGGLTGKSLSTIYSSILYKIETSLSVVTQIDSEEFREAMEFLQMEVIDPENPTAPKLPRFELYHRYEMQYYATVAEVRHWLKGNKTARGSEYSAWYQEKNDGLMALISAAYSRWLVSGKKSEVEKNIAMVDIKSPGEEVEEARRALKNEELYSMDGGTVYYPVHLEPNNWHEYLLAKKYYPTREQLQAKISALKMRLVEVQSLASHDLSTDSSLEERNTPREDLEEATRNVQEAAKAAKCYEYLCQAEKAGLRLSENNTCKAKYPNPQPCKELVNWRDKMDNASRVAFRIQSENDMLRNELEELEGTDTVLEEIAENIQTKIVDLQRQLKFAPIISPEITLAREFQSLSPNKVKENWILFSFDSAQYSKSEKSLPSFVFTEQPGLSSQLSDEGKEFHKSMSKANISVSAKLIRVSINRNWFRPTVFQLNKYLQMQKGSIPVSPGPMINEREFVNEASKFQLPEYTTGFLLAKDLHINFHGIDTSTSTFALQESAQSQFSGQYGPFNAASSFSQDHLTDLEMTSQTDGLHIDVPGAQIIGYFTKVIPKFPYEPEQT